MSTAAMAGYVFISYSRDDIVLMRQIKRGLESRGISIWTDESLVPGTELWKTAIEIAIQDASCIVAILSPSAKESLWVERELDFAKVHEKRIIPVLSHGEPSNAIPIELINAQWVDLRRKSDFEAQLNKLRQAIAWKLTSDGLDRGQQNRVELIHKPKSLTFSKKAAIISIIVIGICAIISLSYIFMVNPSIVSALFDRTIIPSTPTSQTGNKVTYPNTTDSPTQTPTPIGTDTPTPTIQPTLTPPHAPLIENNSGTTLFDEKLIILKIPSGEKMQLKVMDIWSAPEGTPVSCATGFIYFTWLVRKPYPSGGDDLEFHKLIPRGGGRTEIFASGATGSSLAGWCDEITIFNTSLVEYHVEIRYASGSN